MAKKLQLLIDNSQSGNTPPALKAIRVKDSKSAKRLLSRLIVQLQRGEVINETAKDLTYLLNSFIALSKYSAEEKEIDQTVRNYLEVYLRQLQHFSDQFFQEIESFVPAEKLKEYKARFESVAKKFKLEAGNVRKKVLKEINMKTTQKPKVKQDYSNPEQAAAVVINFIRNLSDESFNKVLTIIHEEYFEEKS